MNCAAFTALLGRTTGHRKKDEKEFAKKIQDKATGEPM